MESAFISEDPSITSNTVHAFIKMFYGIQLLFMYQWNWSYGKTYCFVQLSIN